MSTPVLWVKPLKQGLPNLKSAQAYVKRVREGKSQVKDADLQIHYNERKHYGCWSVVIVGLKPVPGGIACVECKTKHHAEDDYLCSNCREAAQQ